MSGGHAPNDRVDAIAVPLGVGESLEQHHADSLAGHVAVGSRVERRVGRPFRQQSGHRQALVVRQAHATLSGGADHQVAVTGQQHLQSNVDRGQRRDLARVDGRGAAHQIPGLADARGERTGAEAARFIDQRRPVRQQHLGVLFADRLTLGAGQTAALEQLGHVALQFGKTESELELKGEVAAELGADHHADRLRSNGRSS